MEDGLTLGYGEVISSLKGLQIKNQDGNKATAPAISSNSIEYNRLHSTKKRCVIRCTIDNNYVAVLLSIY